MDQDERRKYMSDTRAWNAERLLENRAADAARRAAEGDIDPMIKFRADAARADAERAAAREEFAAERAERAKPDIAEIENIIRAAVLSERAFLGEVVAGVLGEALGKLDQEVEQQRKTLASDLGEVRRDLARINNLFEELRNIDRKTVVDVPDFRRVN